MNFWISNSNLEFRILFRNIPELDWNSKVILNSTLNDAQPHDQSDLLFLIRLLS